MKGYRTLAYQALATAGAVAGFLAVYSFSDLGWQAKTVAAVTLTAKLADTVISVWLRFATTTPVGEA